MPYVVDNATDPRYPSRLIIGIRLMSGNPYGGDGEPNAQEIYLECGHSCHNTFGRFRPERAVGQHMRCRICFRDGNLK
jgi:hypothetical protein